MTCRVLCPSVSTLHCFHYSPNAVDQMEWLLSLAEIPLKWHVRSTLQLCFTTGDSDSSCRPQKAFSEKQKIDKPVIVLTDLPHSYQSL